MNLSLLLTDEQYQQRFQGGHQTPYAFEVISADKSIFYYGVQHSRNPQDPQWDALKSYWKRFLETSSGEKSILLEGPERHIEESSVDELIRQFGEAGLVFTWANSAHVSVIWADLSIQEEISKLMELFDRDLVVYFIFVRSAGSWLRSEGMGTFDEVIEKAIQSTAKRIPDASTSLDFYSTIHKQVFKREFSSSEKDTLIRAAAPVYQDSVVNDIARASSRLRNEHIVLEIEKNWNGGKSSFVLFGSSHAVIQEKALKSLLEKNITE